MKPKFHYLVHYPELLLEFGPLVNVHGLCDLKESTTTLRKYPNQQRTERICASPLPEGTSSCKPLSETVRISSTKRHLIIRKGKSSLYGFLNDRFRHFFVLLLDLKMSTKLKRYRFATHGM